VKIALGINHKDIVEAIREWFAARGVPAVHLAEIKLEFRGANGYEWMGLPGGSATAAQVRAGVAFEADAFSSETQPKALTDGS